MNATEHLTRNQIAAFSDGSLAAAESHSVGRHLLRCVDCRTLLPLPDTKRFWAAVTNEQEIEGVGTADEDTSQASTLLASLAGFLTNRSALAWNTGALALVFGLTALGLFMTSDKQSLETEVARSFQIAEPISFPSNRESQDPTSEGSFSVVESKSHADNPDRDRAPANNRSFDARQEQNLRVVDRKRAMTIRPNRNISATRGVTSPCSVGSQVEMELGSQETKFVLRWKPVPNATKYHLYISDDSEILVDEFETQHDTSYVLAKPLDPTKSYKWKMVVSLENGQTLYADAQKFSANEFRSYQKRYQNKARSNTRCLAN